MILEGAVEFMVAFGHYCPPIEFIVIVPWEHRVVCETCVKRVPIIWKRVESCVWTLRGPMCRCGGLFWGRGPKLHGVQGPSPSTSVWGSQRRWHLASCVPQLPDPLWFPFASLLRVNEGRDQLPHSRKILLFTSYTRQWLLEQRPPP